MPLAKELTMTVPPHSAENPLPTANDILRLMAAQTSIAAKMDTLLSYALDMVGADAAVVAVFEGDGALYRRSTDEAEVPDYTALRGLLRGLSRDLYVRTVLPPEWAAYRAAVVAPLYDKDSVGGGLFLLVGRDLEPEGDLAALTIILDAVQVLAQGVMNKLRYEKTLRNQYEFVRIVTHDLRSPLTSMQGFASMLEAQSVGQLNERQMHYISKVLMGTAQLANLIENIADAGRYDPDTGFYEMELALTDPVELVRRLVNEYIMPAAKDLRLSVEVSANLPIIMADPVMLERALINLIDNAVKYTPAGGHIEVGARQEGDELCLYVKDDGLGISPEHRSQLFKRHFRIRRPEHRLVKGSGLGLFIVRSVAIYHGGDAFVESTPGEGSTFGLRLPLRAAQPAANTHHHG
jgi:signal transduction histidine kinase